MKKILKIFIILMIILILQVSCNYNQVLAEADSPDGTGTGTGTTDQDEITDLTEIIDPNDYEPNSEESTYRLQQRANIIVAVIRNVGIVIAVIALMVIGLRTMVGSAEEKSAYKQSLPGYILGVIMIAAISLIPTVIYNVVSNW